MKEGIEIYLSDIIEICTQLENHSFALNIQRMCSTRLLRNGYWSCWITLNTLIDDHVIKLIVNMIPNMFGNVKSTSK